MRKNLIIMSRERKVIGVVDVVKHGSYGCRCLRIVPMITYFREKVELWLKLRLTSDKPPMIYSFRRVLPISKERYFVILLRTSVKHCVFLHIALCFFQ